jgi:glycosyltransferase involved in cell wall biosynthesis
LFNTHLAVTTKRTYFIPENTPFILTLSTLEPRKNLLNTIAGFEKMLEDHPQVNANLVIAGPAGWHTKELKKYRRNKRILFTGFINEFHLPALYNEAAALCYVSRNEGFGLPILEAMACGTPVIFGNNSSMKEYFSGFGLAADPDDIQEIANHMYLLLSNPEAQKHYSSLALQRSFDFSWRKTAMQTLQAYEKFINIKAKFTS